ncbi:MAG: ABC transporter permease [Hungatella sp.]|mgnify:CR=1 FL=1|jgi:peptide/nickel transport system permease protein|nr:ABC transporter permease [Hungatella sp.]
MASFEQAASLAARAAVNSAKNGFSQEQRLSAVERIEEEELLFLPKPDTIGTKLLNMCRENKVAAFSGVVLAVMAAAILFADKLTVYDPNGVNLMERLLPPSGAHWCGTDELGRDIFTRILYGGRVSLLVGVIPTTISMAIGIVLGMVSGYIRQTEAVIMRLADIVLAFPSIVLAMVVMYTLGATTTNIFVALSMIGWAKTARVVRSQTLSLREQEFVEAARGMGVGKWTIMFRHILPNCLPSLIVLFTLNIPDAILSEANLSFLGVGTQPPDSSWGLMVSQARTFAQSSPWMLIFPSLAILIMVLALNFLGDGLRDALDPHGK